MAERSERRLNELAQDAARDHGCELYHLDFHRAGARSVLRVMIDRPEEGGIGLDDCAAVSRSLGAMIEAEDAIATSYTLEVSSPGLDRPLFREGDYQRFSGRRARVTTFAPVEGRRHFQGTILSCAGGLLRLAVEDGAVRELPLETVASGRLEVEI